MRKEDIQKGTLYAAAGPGDSYSRAKKVCVRAVTVGVETRHSRGRLDGTLVRLERDAEWSNFGRKRAMKGGHEYVLPNRDIARLWTADDDAEEVVQQHRAEATSALRARLLALGLDEAGTVFSGVEGFTIGPEEVTIDRGPFEAWIERIDPAKIAGEAIGMFVTNVKEEMPWTGVADISTPTIGRFKEAAVQEVREGVAVSDGELSADA